MNFDLDTREVNYIINLLVERPYKEVALLIDKITDQAKKPEVVHTGGTKKDDGEEEHGSDS